MAYEALARWEGPDRGNILPDDFILITKRVSMVNRLAIPSPNKAPDAAARWPKASAWPSTSPPMTVPPRKPLSRSSN